MNCTQGVTHLIDLFILAGCLINHFAIPLIFTLTFIAILYGITMYIKDSQNESKREGFRDYIIYAIGGLFVMLAAVALVRIISTSLKIGQGGDFKPPQLPE